MNTKTELPQPDDPEHIRKLIRRTLNNYPSLSVSMMASHIRPYDRNWRTTLEEMIELGEVIRHSKRSGNRVIYVHSLKQPDRAAS